MDEIEQIFQDITSLKIQGATNVALATIDEIIKLSLSVKNTPNPYKVIYEAGFKLAYARPTEPLAQNSLRFIFEVSGQPIDYYRQKAQDYRQIMINTKSFLVDNAANLIKDKGVYFTHCHSTSVVDMFLKAKNSGHNFSVYVTETRPLYQGRKTACQLYENGITDVTILADSASSSLLTNNRFKLDGVFLGADLLSKDGFVNKIGSLSISRFARDAGIPVYSLSTLLKFDPRPFSLSFLEIRPSAEIWNDKEVTLKVFNPAFDYVPYFDGLKIISEYGLLMREEILDKVLESYPFILKDSEYLKNTNNL